YVCLFLFFFPNTGTANYAAGTLAMLKQDAADYGSAMTGIALCTVFALFAFNFYATAVRVHFKKSYLFDTVRFGLQLVAIIFLVVAAITGTTENRFYIFKSSPYVTAAMLVAAVALFIIPLIIVALASAKKRKAERALEEVIALEAEAEDEEEEPLIIPLPPADEPIQELFTEPVPEPLQKALPEPSAEHQYVPQDMDVDSIFGPKQEEISDPKENYINDFIAKTNQSEEEENMFDPTNDPDQTLSDEVNDEPLEEEEEEDEVIVFTADNFDPNNPIIFGSTIEPNGAIGGNPSFFAGSAEKPKEEKKKPAALTAFEQEMARQATAPLSGEQTAAPETDPRYPFIQINNNAPAAQQPAQPAQPSFITPSAPQQSQASSTPERERERERPDYFDRPERPY
ncbi:MAG: hypothetical protein K2N74_05980, partial [Clostridiales bacterium]|nr:hypothetical protein [Clostridiales bacterium]